MTKLACDATHEANPEAIRIINNCCTWGEYATTDVTYFGKSPRPRTTPYRYLKDCLEKSVDFEVIGLQLYYPAQDMFEIGLQLDRFSRLGKPIHVTELGVSSENVPDPTAMIREVSHYYWHGPWSEEAQTDWIEQFYTLCYSKSYINAITWWDFADVGHFFPHGGFLRSNLTPKKSYYVLKNLIEKWSLL
jgi:GH35 family endo-1,4-beta-xylanase